MTTVASAYILIQPGGLAVRTYKVAGTTIRNHQHPQFMIMDLDNKQYRIVGLFEVRKFREFCRWDRFVKFKPLKNIFQNVRILNYMAACIPSTELAQ